MTEFRRRDLIRLAVAAAAGWPPRAPAQRRSSRGIGYLDMGFQNPVSTALVAAFRRGLGEQAHDEQSARLSLAWAEFSFDRLLDFAADLAHGSIDMIVAAGPLPALAARSATAKIPIVFVLAGDPVALNLVRSLERPGGDITGVILPSTELVRRRLEQLHEISPAAGLTGFLVNSTAPETKTRIAEGVAAARSLGIHLVILDATIPNQIERAFETLQRQRLGALMVDDDPLFLEECATVSSLAAKFRVPAMYAYREAVDAGGLMSFGAKAADAWRLAGISAGRILGGDDPAQLPVRQVNRLERVINLKTAKALGIELPDAILSQADAVIR
ncbi:MAG TPA: ABC transporter substrate-binding protein [Xanthobacteraceae bacterium]